MLRKMEREQAGDRGIGESQERGGHGPGGRRRRVAGRIEAHAARGVDSVQIEVNKKFFMDTKTFRATAGLAKLKADIDKLLGMVVEDTRKRIKSA